MLLEFFLIFLIGISVGSFLNVVIYRVNHDGSPLQGRSYCPKCKHTLAWYDLIPLFSFVLLLGKCRYCGKKISFQYPIVELTMGVLAVWVWRYVIRDPSTSLGTGMGYDIQFIDIVQFLLLLGVFASFLVIFVSDFLYSTVPTAAVISGGLGIFGLLGINFYAAPLLSLPYLETALGSSLFFYFLVFITRGKGMGFGDVELAFLMGLFLGWPKALVAFYLAFLTGAMIGVILILLGKKHFGEQIAFGPFLVGATFVSFLWGEQLWRLIMPMLGGTV